MTTPNDTPTNKVDQRTEDVTTPDEMSVDQFLGLPLDDLTDDDKGLLALYADQNKIDATVANAVERITDRAPIKDQDDGPDSAVPGVAADEAAGTPVPSQEAHTRAGDSAPDAGMPDTATADTGASAPAASLNINYGGRDFTIDEQTAQQLLDQASWVASKPDDYWVVMNGIESGDVVALTRADYETLLRSAEAAAQTAAPSAPELKKVDPNASMDPELAQAFNALVDRVNAFAPQQNPQREVPQTAVEPGRGGAAPAQVAAAARQQAANEAIIDTVSSNLAQRYGLTDDEVTSLFEHTLGLGLVQRTAAKYTRTAPDGSIIRQPDMNKVYEEAFEAGLASHTSLREKYISTLSNERAANEAALNGPVAAKKARSASLASVPSAASATPNRDVRSMSPQEREAAIADYLRREMAS